MAKDIFRSIEYAERGVLPHQETSGDAVFDEHIVAPWKRFRTNERAFAHDGTYQEADVNRDLAYVKKAEADFEDEGPEATGLYYGVMEGVEMYEWFGPDAKVVRSSRFDDVARGVDFVAAFRREGKPSIKIAIDVTTSDDASVLEHKLFRISDRLEKEGRLTRLKYFDYPEKEDLGPDEEEPHGYADMPHVIIGTNRESAKKLIEDFASALVTSGGKRGLGEHAIQFPLLREMNSQLIHELMVAANAVSRNAHSPEVRTKAVQELLEWKRSIGASQELSNEQFASLEELIEKNGSELAAMPMDAARSAVYLAESVITIGKIAKEKGVSQIADAIDTEDQKDQTVRRLSKAA